jgi:hypothetical protein
MTRYTAANAARATEAETLSAEDAAFVEKAWNKLRDATIEQAEQWLAVVEQSKPAAAAALRRQLTHRGW